jgi:hypothetical protein
MRKYTAILTIVSSLFLAACASLKPGADALVVRAEQTEASAKASFDLLLSIDHSDRGFWKTNLPAFHGFCEWLREPQIALVTNILPRASAMILSVNAVKRDYILSKSYSNSLVSAIAVLESACAEAGTWHFIVTNSTTRPIP